MKTHPLPDNFSGAKFALRYGLDAMKDFHAVGGVLFYPDTLPDEPIFEPPDPPVDKMAGLKLALDAAINPPVGPSIDVRVKAVLVEWRKLI